eukprot:TRINITY_DN2285_c0_g1_i7.p1 TRINITY_DN2285_c0_g1~~TRINITY_DN2285_c0_g1_i7.p1  ORF type:complete len:2234 (+),score=1111.07 TRINITY_DN2285_c0_g1_i7:66-6767(+)
MPTTTVKTILGREIFPPFPLQLSQQILLLLPFLSVTKMRLFQTQMRQFNQLKMKRKISLKQQRRKKRIQEATIRILDSNLLKIRVERMEMRSIPIHSKRFLLNRSKKSISSEFETVESAPAFSFGDFSSFPNHSHSSEESSPLSSSQSIQKEEEFSFNNNQPKSTENDANLVNNNTNNSEFDFSFESNQNEQGNQEEFSFESNLNSENKNKLEGGFNDETENFNSKPLDEVEKKEENTPFVSQSGTEETKEEEKKIESDFSSNDKKEDEFSFGSTETSTGTETKNEEPTNPVQSFGFGDNISFGTISSSSQIKNEETETKKKDNLSFSDFPSDFAPSFESQPEERKLDQNQNFSFGFGEEDKPTIEEKTEPLMAHEEKDFLAPSSPSFSSSFGSVLEEEKKPQEKVDESTDFSFNSFDSTQNQKTEGSFGFDSDFGSSNENQNEESFSFKSGEENENQTFSFEPQPEEKKAEENQSFGFGEEKNKLAIEEKEEPLMESQERNLSGPSSPSFSFESQQPQEKKEDQSFSFSFGEENKSTIEEKEEPLMESQEKKQSAPSSPSFSFESEPSEVKKVEENQSFSFNENTSNLMEETKVEEEKVEEDDNIFATFSANLKKQGENKVENNEEQNKEEDSFGFDSKAQQIQPQTDSFGFEPSFADTNAGFGSFESNTTDSFSFESNDEKPIEEKQSNSEEIKEDKKSDEVEEEKKEEDDEEYSFGFASFKPSTPKIEEDETQPESDFTSNSNFGSSNFEGQNESNSFSSFGSKEEKKEEVKTSFDTNFGEEDSFGSSQFNKFETNSLKEENEDFSTTSETKSKEEENKEEDSFGFEEKKGEAPSSQFSSDDFGDFGSFEDSNDAQFDADFGDFEDSSSNFEQDSSFSFEEPPKQAAPVVSQPAALPSNNSKALFSLSPEEIQRKVCEVLHVEEEKEEENAQIRRDLYDYFQEKKEVAPEAFRQKEKTWSLDPSLDRNQSVIIHAKFQEALGLSASSQEEDPDDKPIMMKTPLRASGIAQDLTESKSNLLSSTPTSTPSSNSLSLLANQSFSSPLSDSKSLPASTAKDSNVKKEFDFGSLMGIPSDPNSLPDFARNLESEFEFAGFDSAILPEQSKEKKEEKGKDFGISTDFDFNADFSAGGSSSVATTHSNEAKDEKGDDFSGFATELNQNEPSFASFGSSFGSSTDQSVASTKSEEFSFASLSAPKPAENSSSGFDLGFFGSSSPATKSAVKVSSAFDDFGGFSVQSSFSDSNIEIPSMKSENKISIAPPSSLSVRSSLSDSNVTSNFDQFGAFSNTSTAGDSSFGDFASFSSFGSENSKSNLTESKESSQGFDNFGFDSTPSVSSSGFGSFASFGEEKEAKKETLGGFEAFSKPLSSSSSSLPQISNDSFGDFGAFSSTKSSSLNNSSASLPVIPQNKPLEVSSFNSTDSDFGGFGSFSSSSEKPLNQSNLSSFSSNFGDLSSSSNNNGNDNNNDFGSFGSFSVEETTKLDSLPQSPSLSSSANAESFTPLEESEDNSSGGMFSLLKPQEPSTFLDDLPNIPWKSAVTNSSAFSVTSSNSAPDIHAKKEEEPLSIPQDKVVTSSSSVPDVYLSNPTPSPSTFGFNAATSFADSEFTWSDSQSDNTFAFEEDTKEESNTQSFGFNDSSFKNNVVESSFTPSSPQVTKKEEEQEEQGGFMFLKPQEVRGDDYFDSLPSLVSNIPPKPTTIQPNPQQQIAPKIEEKPSSTFATEGISIPQKASSFSFATGTIDFSNLVSPPKSRSSAESSPRTSFEKPSIPSVSVVNKPALAVKEEDFGDFTNSSDDFGDFNSFESSASSNSFSFNTPAISTAGFFPSTSSTSSFNTNNNNNANSFGFDSVQSSGNFNNVAPPKVAAPQQNPVDFFQQSSLPPSSFSQQNQNLSFPFQPSQSNSNLPIFPQSSQSFPAQQMPSNVPTQAPQDAEETGGFMLLKPEAPRADSFLDSLPSLVSTVQPTPKPAVVPPKPTLPVQEAPKKSVAESFAGISGIKKTEAPKPAPKPMMAMGGAPASQSSSNFGFSTVGIVQPSTSSSASFSSDDFGSFESASTSSGADDFGDFQTASNSQSSFGFSAPQTHFPQTQQTQQSAYQQQNAYQQQASGTQHPGFNLGSLQMQSQFPQQQPHFPPTLNTQQFQQTAYQPQQIPQQFSNNYATPFPNTGFAQQQFPPTLNHQQFPQNPNQFQQQQLPVQQPSAYFPQNQGQFQQQQHFPQPNNASNNNFFW